MRDAVLSVCRFFSVGWYEVRSFFIEAAGRCSPATPHLIALLVCVISCLGSPWWCFGEKVYADRHTTFPTQRHRDYCWPWLDTLHASWSSRTTRSFLNYYGLGILVEGFESTWGISGRRSCNCCCRAACGQGAQVEILSMSLENTCRRTLSNTFWYGPVTCFSNFRRWYGSVYARSPHKRMQSMLLSAHEIVMVTTLIVGSA